MVGDTTIAIDVAARLDNFAKEMAKIPGISAEQAKLMAAEINKSVKAAEKAAKDATKNAKGGMKEFGDAAGKTGQNAQKLAGALGLLSPKAADAARNIGDLADVGEVGADVAGAMGISTAALGAALLVAAEVAAAAYIAYRVYNEETDRAAETTKWLADAEAKLKPLLDDTRDATIDLKVATGELTEEAAKLERVSIKAFAAYQEATKETRSKLSELKGEQGGVWTQMVDGAESVVPAWTPLGMLIDGLTTDSEEYQGQIEALQGSLDKATDTLRTNVGTHKAVIEAEKKGKDSKEALKRSTDRAKEALAALNNELEREAKLAAENEATYQSAIDALMAQEHAAKRAVADKAEQIAMDHDAALATATAERDKALAVADSVSARETIEEQYRATAKAADEQYYADLKELREKDSAAADKTADESAKAQADALKQAYTQGAQFATDMLEKVQAGFADAYQSAANNVSMLEQQLSDGEKFYTASQKAELKKRIAAQKQAARQAFEAQKIAAMAEAAINTALAVSEALSSAPWPYSLIPAGFALAGGIAQEAAIASEQPAFHAGGALDLQPDEMSITARRKEFVLNPAGRRAIGDDALHRANAGVSNSPTVVAVSVYKHTRQVDRWKSDGLLAGDPIAQAINAGKLVGLRSNRG